VSISTSHSSEQAIALTTEQTPKYNIEQALTITKQSPSGGGQPQAVMQPVVAPSLTASNDPFRSPQSAEITQQVTAVHAATMTLRRLTPVEYERLMGWEDHWTAFGADGEPLADTHRYRMCGNGVASPVARWIAERIGRVL